ncbi:MAG: hypothetical protein V3T17_08875 [Pseudomonadales bacterium]
MANLVVRNIDESIVRALKAKSGEKGISAQALHRQILADTLLNPAKKPFVEVLASIPNVGEDADFERIQDAGADDVFN